MAGSCVVPPSGRRNLFWSTQAQECGTDQLCGTQCGYPGLAVQPTVATGDEDAGGEATISTENWLQGLIINMLLTDGRKPDTACGYRPGAQGGHWSSSYIDEGPSDIGTLIRTIPTSGRVQEITNLLKAYATSTLERLVQRGVAIGIEPSVSYIGDGRFQLDVLVYGPADTRTKVGLSVSRLENEWIWQNDM